MNQIKISHEAPLSIFEEITELTDYQYCLVHLMDESPEYRDKFINLCKEKHEVILDNSIFELGTAFKGGDYLKWVKAKSIGVVQGKTLEEITRCYRALERLGVDMIAISFDYSLYEKMFPHPNQKLSWMMGRVQLLGILLDMGIINPEIPHHLLGAGLPQEGLYYRDYNWIYSTDTSNPIVHGIKGKKYIENQGLWSKESQKLHEMIHYPEEEIDMDLVRYNIGEFRKYWRG